MSQSIDIKNLSLVELKAFAYDLHNSILQNQNALKTILQEVDNRNKTSLIPTASAGNVTNSN